MRRVSVAAPSRLSLDAAVEVADAGGNAVDAAIASTMAGMVTEPGMIAPGASGFIAVWPPDGDPVVIDAYAEMPGRGLGDVAGRGHGERIYMAYGGGMETLVGHGSIATPGAIAGLGMVSEQFGAMSWAEVVAPSAGWAEQGFPLSPVAAAYLTYSHEPIFDKQPESYRALHHDDGTPLIEGEIVHIDGLADSLRLLADRGPEEFYTGSLGRRMAAEVQAHGGLLNAEDLAAYRPIVREPVAVEVDGWRVATNPPPALGGSVLAAMLLLAEGRPFREWTTEEARRLARVQRAVLRYRARVLDAAADRAAAADFLLERARMGDLGALMDSPSTIHTSCVDTDGLACSVTVSAGYGSGIMVPGTGLWLNNSLGELELHPAGLDAFGPGDRLPSNMAPTVARRGDGAVLAIGSPGASRITTAISQVLLNFIHLGMSLTDAVEHPRLHVEVFDGKPTIAFEPGIPVEPFDDLVARRFPDLSMYFGGIGVTLWDPLAGHFEATDPRRSGAVGSGGR
jgi:gamma-glutamyltranspeptidase/glutathione hydrolase